MKVRTFLARPSLRPSLPRWHVGLLLAFFGLVAIWAFIQGAP